jgi:hypothetical protein
MAGLAPQSTLMAVHAVHIHVGHISASPHIPRLHSSFLLLPALKCDVRRAEEGQCGERPAVRSAVQLHQFALQWICMSLQTFENTGNSALLRPLHLER